MSRKVDSEPGDLSPATAHVALKGRRLDVFQRK
jgi:hypothetical protein